jgi:flavin-binding protein dodecin
MLFLHDYFFATVEDGLNRKKEVVMSPESTYKIIELVGTSKTSWEEAAKNAIETASKSLRDLRIAEITKLDVTIDDGKITGYRTRVNVSFKYHGE